MTGIISYSSKEIVQCQIKADVFNPETYEQNTTNTFHFNFLTEGTKVQVIPQSYEEVITYLSARRRIFE